MHGTRSRQYLIENDDDDDTKDDNDDNDDKDDYCCNSVNFNPIHGACFYTLIMAHVVLKATSVSLGHSGIHFFGA